MRVLCSGLCIFLGLLLILFVLNDKNWRPIHDKETWKVTSNYSRLAAPDAIDRDLDTYWTSYVPVTSGIFFQVELPSVQPLNGILLDLGEMEEGDHPVYWVLKTSRDGIRWQTVFPREQFTYRSLFVVIFPAVDARYIQMIHTSTSSKRIRWTITELDLLRPIVPWQFERTTMIFWIAGVLFCLLFLFVRFSLYKTFLRPYHLVLAACLLALLSGAWFLRVYHISEYGLFDQEFERLAYIHIEEPRHETWLSTYFDQNPGGPSWLALLLIRWGYEVCENIFAAMRFIPALFAMLTCLLLCVPLYRSSVPPPTKIARIFNISPAESSQYLFWERLLMLIFFSVAGYPVLVSRQGNFAVAVVFVLLLYLLSTYRFLYQQGSYLWPVFMAILLMSGYFIDPFIGLAPAGVLLFGAGHALLNRLKPYQQHIQLFSVPSFAHWIGFLLSVLPLAGYWGWRLQQTDEWKMLFARPESLFSHVWQEVVNALSVSGFSGVLLVLLSALAVVGMMASISEKRQEEWFLIIQALLFFFGYSWMSKLENAAPILVMSGLFFWLAAKGLMFGLTFLGKRWQGIQRVGLPGITLLLGVYLALFSLNTLFWGNSSFPLAADVLAAYHQQKIFHPLIYHIIEDADECKTVASLDPALTDAYVAIYPELNLGDVNLKELQRLAKLGRFWTYLLTPLSISEDLTSFLHHYYDELGKTSRMRFYAVRNQGYPLRQRYIWEDLYRDIGRHVEDAASSSGIVKVATPKDRGYLSFAPLYPICQPGRYIARFVLRVVGGEPEDIVASLKVVADSYNTLIRREVQGKDFPDPLTYYHIDLPFTLEFENPAFLMRRLQFLVRTTGKAEVRLDYIELVLQEF